MNQRFAKYAIAVVIMIATACAGFVFSRLRAKKAVNDSTSSQPTQQPRQSREYLDSCPVADGFDFPVGPPDAKGYYNAQLFGKNNHLGEDWNGRGGGNSDLGDSIHSIANGIVFYAKEAGPGWGNVVRIYHNIGTQASPQFVESLYAHLKTVEVSEGDVVIKGQKLGTMGNVDGRYYAHLHLEVRTKIGMPVGGGYSPNRDGFTEPTAFIRSRRTIE